MQTGSWRVLGLMSGTSCDGLDLCLARFCKTDLGWAYEIEKSHSSAFTPDWQERLLQAHLLSGRALMQLDADLGRHFAQEVTRFLADVACPPLLISSHGHTVFHEPNRGLSCQIGQAAALAATLQLPVVSDFRTLDVQLGGEGAPLVPIGDALLFSKYTACLNLGGIANISMDIKGNRIAHDIAACNMVFNHFSRQLGREFDEGGQIAASGKPIPALLAQLEALPLYQQKPLPSLGREYFEQMILPILESFDASPADIMHSWSLHLSHRIGKSLIALPASASVLISGGGAYNQFLCDCIAMATPLKIELAETEIIEQKEALIFGFLGLLRYLGHINVLRTVTGASRDHSAGTLIHAFR
ncbi:MAG: anhydro-N-acetylmuramic acid kinase [Bacteroidia bacterium]